MKKWFLILLTVLLLFVVACKAPENTSAQTPQSDAATRISGFGLPSLPGGVTMMSSLTPAIFAGIAFISTELG